MKASKQALIHLYMYIHIVYNCVDSFRTVAGHTRPGMCGAQHLSGTYSTNRNCVLWKNIGTRNHSFLLAVRLLMFCIAIALDRVALPGYAKTVRSAPNISTCIHNCKHTHLHDICICVDMRIRAYILMSGVCVRELVKFWGVFVEVCIVYNYKIIITYLPSILFNSSV